MKIKASDLLLQIKLALQDEFEGQVVVNDNCISLCFENGQKFSLQLIEE